MLSLAPKLQHRFKRHSKKTTDLIRNGKRHLTGLALLSDPRLRPLLLHEQLSAVHPQNSAALRPPAPHHVVGIACRRRACAVARCVSRTPAVSRYAYILIKHTAHLYG